MPRLSNRPSQMCRYAGNKARVSINGKYHYLGLWGSEHINWNCHQWEAVQGKTVNCKSRCKPKVEPLGFS